MCAFRSEGGVSVKHVKWESPRMQHEGGAGDQSCWSLLFIIEKVVICLHCGEVGSILDIEQTVSGDPRQSLLGSVNKLTTEWNGDDLDTMLCRKKWIPMKHFL